MGALNEAEELWAGVLRIGGIIFVFQNGNYTHISPRLSRIMIFPSMLLMGSKLLPLSGSIASPIFSHTSGLSLSCLLTSSILQKGSL